MGFMKNSSPQNSDQWNTAQQAAAILNVNERTVHRMCKDGRLPHIKLNRGYRILSSTLLNLAEILTSKNTTSATFCNDEE